jgi:hypothetical protein
MKTAGVRPASHAAQLKQLSLGQSELNHSAPLLRRKPLYSLREPRRYVELNHFCHESILQASLFGAAQIHINNYLNIILGPVGK